MQIPGQPTKRWDRLLSASFSHSNRRLVHSIVLRYVWWELQFAKRFWTVCGRAVDYLAVLRASDTQRLDALLDEIGEIDGVLRTTTSVLLAMRVDRVA